MEYLSLSAVHHCRVAKSHRPGPETERLLNQERPRSCMVLENNDVRDELIRRIGRGAGRKVGVLAVRIVRADSRDRGSILDELEVQRWLAEACRDCSECDDDR